MNVLTRLPGVGIENLIMMIKGLLFDYGGTIDSNGVHWGELLWSFYVQYKIPVTKEVFREAYVFGEKALALHPLVQPSHDFQEVLVIKLNQQFQYLYSQNHLAAEPQHKEVIAAIAKNGSDFAASCIEKARPVISKLADQYPLVLVSNFYGNITSVLETYGIRHFFRDIVESAVVGVRKPDPEIFSLGVKCLGMAPEQCVAIGDSYKKDIVPAKQAGCQTIWLKGEGWEQDPAIPGSADKIIKSFTELSELLAGGLPSSR